MCKLLKAYFSVPKDFFNAVAALRSIAVSLADYDEWLLDNEPKGT